MVRTEHVGDCSYYQREGTGTERVRPPLIQVVLVGLRLGTVGLGADAIE